ncbi:HlyD family efflux transporter periplasmic adaptor subunit [Flavobacterium sp. CFS9]|uniref:HlyD family efflux transporter periplasmic adaptor subunit n=1 Tax=Flavobacterium sp. CFS9 TaxID=3143118 RepID=A0AAT9H0Z6_9FLAO
MEEIKDGLKIYSEEVHDILSDPPKSIQKWGNSILFIFIIILLLISWFIKYPDIITSQIIITTNIPPQKIQAKLSGKIEAILVKDRSEVKLNTPIAVFENSANYKDVFALKNILNTINIKKTEFPFEKLKYSQLGDIESAFTNFQKENTADQLNTELRPYKVEGDAQNYESIQLKERLHLLESQKEINESELTIQTNDLNRYELLFKKGIYSTQEVEKQRLLYLQAQKGYKTLLSTISQLKSSLNELNKNNKTTQINERKEDSNVNRNKIQAFYQLKNAVKEWELKYLLSSATNGIINFLQLWSRNQPVEAGQILFSIIPKDQNGYIGKLKAPVLNSGKIKPGQKVNIKLLNYPQKEFGIIKGIIIKKSLTPDKEGNILIDVNLPRGLETSYKKNIPFQQEMQGTADIITEDLRLIERLLYQFKSVFVK